MAERDECMCTSRVLLESSIDSLTSMIVADFWYRDRALLLLSYTQTKMLGTTY